MKLAFTVKNNNVQKDFIWNSILEEDVWQAFSSAILELWPDEKLPNQGSLLFRQTGNSIELNCKKSLVINGVSVNNRILKTGDRIILGPLRIFFKSFELTVEPAVPETHELHLPSINPESLRKCFKLLPAAAIILAIGAAGIVAGCMTAPESTAPESTISETTTPETISVEIPELIKPDETIPIHENLLTVPKATIDTERILVISPGEFVPKIDLDILFIHAHPDDESLDFGSLLALADSAGLKTGLVTFTDGESGLDLYPDRPVTGTYPDHYMEFDELAGVRSQEVVNAAVILGVDLLIRLGLKNHPYNSLNDEIDPEEILEIWGGMDILTSKLREIVDKTNPETVVAPDKPSQAREHFEHEAVGYLAAELMAGFKPQEPKVPKRFITCIDPRQNNLYPEASTINSEQKIKNNKSGNDSSLREIQINALRMHKTQNDAINVGTDFLPKYPAEYYQIQYWRTNQNWEEWTATLGE